MGCPRGQRPAKENGAGADMLVTVFPAKYCSAGGPLLLEMQRLETYEATDTVIAPRNDDLNQRAQTSVFRTYLIYVISAVVPLGTWFYVQDTPSHGHGGG